MNVLVSMYNYNRKYTFVNYKFDFFKLYNLRNKKNPLDFYYH